MEWHFKTNLPPLGKGGFGSVYPCHQFDGKNLINDQLAVKICTFDSGDDPVEKAKRFRNGARLGRRLRHPNIMPVIAFADRKVDGTPYIVMPLATGGNLDTWLNEQPRLESECVEVFKQVLDAVAFAHSQNILHRDIKAENILFLDGVPRVADFDLAKDVDPVTAATAITASQVGFGTPGYVSPEQCSDLKHVGPPTDVYALARLLWRMLSGRQPPHLVGLDLQAVPAQYRAFIEKGSEFRRHERYGSAGEMLRAFEALIAAPPGSPKQVAQDLVGRWNQDEPDKHWRTLKQLDEHFQRHPDDEELHYELAPFLPPAMLDAWMKDHPGGFAQMVAAVDDVSSGNLVWDDCDGFARFYLRVFASSSDAALRAHAIERVVRIAASHNRYPVAGMLRGALSEVSDDDAAIAARGVRAAGGYALWFHVPASFHPDLLDAFQNPGATDPH